jgi:hypothetical protein
MFGNARSWFGRQSKVGKSVTVLVAIAAGVGTVVAAVNGSIDLYNKLTAERKAARSLELIDVDFVPHKQQPSNTQDLVASESYSAGITSVS